MSIQDTSQLQKNGSPALIRLQNLGRTFTEGDQKHVVFGDVNLEVEAGEIVVLLGRSGSGKSTLLNLIAGIDLPTSGRIEIASKSLTTLSEQERTLFRRRHIGFIFQFFNLIPTLTCEENLLLPLELNGEMGPEASAKARLLLREVGLAGRETSFPDRLSGGEQQRIAVARALIHRPDIILADEPTGNLDKETGLDVLHLLDRLVRREEKTMIMATHSREVMGLADRIVTFDDGHLLEKRAEELL